MPANPSPTQRPRTLRARALPRSVALGLFVGLALAALPAAADDPFTIEVQAGRIAADGASAQMTVSIQNELPVTLRVVGLVAEYDTVSGMTLTFAANLDVRVPPGETVTEEVRADTDGAAGEQVDWTRPYTLEPVVGADIAALSAAAGATGRDVAEVERMLTVLRALANPMRIANSRHAQRLGEIGDREAWFDADSLVDLRPGLQDALCAAYGRSVEAAGGAQARIDRFREAQARLLEQSLYHDCMGDEVMLRVGRDFQATGRVQDALVLVQRTPDGTIEDAWREIFIEGSLALAENASGGQADVQFTPGITALNAVTEVAPAHPRLEAIATRLLAAATAHIQGQVEGQMEAEALELLGLMRMRYAEHPQVQRASEIVAAGLVEYGIRATQNDNPTRANNAFVWGEANFAGLPAWEDNKGRLQTARTGFYLAAIRTALRDGHIDLAEASLQEIADRRLPTDGAEFAAVSLELLEARWARVEALVAADDLSEAFRLGEEIVLNQPDIERLGERVPRTFMTIGETIWDRYGFLGASFAGKRMEIAARALERGRSVDPERADALIGKIERARWILPIVLAVVFALGVLIFVMRGAWRKRLKAKRLWHSGTREVERGSVADGVEKLEQAYSLIGFDQRAAEYVGAESRGHMVLAIADAHEKRGRQDQVRLWSGEWKALEAYEQPLSRDFDAALAQYKRGDKAAE
jgi:hypothetical protein